MPLYLWPNFSVFKFHSKYFYSTMSIFLENIAIIQKHFFSFSEVFVNNSKFFQKKKIFLYRTVLVFNKFWKSSKACINSKKYSELILNEVPAFSNIFSVFQSFQEFTAFQNYSDFCRPNPIFPEILQSNWRFFFTKIFR